MLWRAAIKEVTGAHYRTVDHGGTSDAASLRHLPQVIEFGPTNATIHKVNECLPVPKSSRCRGLPAHHRAIAVGTR